jgi:hypothetical protein
MQQTEQTDNNLKPAPPHGVDMGVQI